MKKTAKSILLFMVMAILLLALTGCGENQKLVATKSGEDDFFGKYEETVEITFKDKKADKIVMTRELEDEEVAKSIEKLIGYLNTDEGMKFEVDGKKVTITFKPEAYAKEEGLSDSDLSRKSLKKELEDAGYKVK
jgi:hypothetical protein